MNTFESLKLDDQLLGAVNRLGFKEPTQIQRETIPLILDGKDVIGESATGSGKTLAFGAGIIKHCKTKGGVQAIVLVPTRELAEQVKDEMIKLSYKKPIKILAIYGGVSINPQIDNLKKSEVIVATPGRLLDHLSRNTIDTSRVNTLVLDEADRMVEMGFIEDVERIMKECPKDRQTLLFSATMYGPAKKIAMKYMNDPTTVHSTKMVDPKKLKQTYYDVPSNLKKELLIHLLEKEKSELVMVFCNTRRATDMVIDSLKASKIKAAPIHGGLNQVKRLKTIELFHKGKFQVLVCTDVAARGLHIEGVTHIYNFDISIDPADYVHRIGRTARAGKEGLVINILAPRDYDNFSRLTTVHREFKIQKEERPFLKAVARVNNDRGYNADRSRRDDRGGRNDRDGRYSRNDRDGRSGRNDRDGRYGRNDRDGRSGRNDRDSRYGRNDRDDRSGRNDRDSRYGRNDRDGRSDGRRSGSRDVKRDDRFGRSNRDDNRNGRNDRDGRSNRDNRSGRSDGRRSSGRDVKKDDRFGRSTKPSSKNSSRKPLSRKKY